MEANPYEVDAAALLMSQTKPQPLTEEEKENIKEPSITKEPMLVTLRNTVVYKESTSPNSREDPYSKQRDFLFYMPLVIKQLYADFITETCPADVEKLLGTYEFERRLKCYNSFVDMLNYFTGEEAKQTIDEASKEAGYYEQPADLKLAIEAALGRLFVASYFFGARVMAPMGKHPPEWIGYTDGTFEQMAREANSAIDGVETPYARSVKQRVKETIGNR